MRSHRRPEYVNIPDDDQSNVVELRSRVRNEQQAGNGSPENEGREEVRESGSELDRREPLWFLHPSYQPCPEFDVTVGGYCFRFKPEYCDYFMDRARETGASLVGIATELALPFKIVKHWSSKIPALAVALDLAQQNVQAYWELRGMNMIMDKKFNAAGWLRFMAVQFPTTWREIEADAMVQEPDPYGFNQRVEEADAMVNTQTVFDRLLKLKAAAEEGEPTRTDDAAEAG